MDRTTHQLCCTHPLQHLKPLDVKSVYKKIKYHKEKKKYTSAKEWGKK